VTYALVARSDGGLVGAMGLAIAAQHRRAELGYWVGVPHWNRGYATEAGRALLAYAFGPLGLHRVEAHHFTRNPASGRVMQKLGMRPEGVHRDVVLKWDRFEDLASYAVLESDDWAGAPAGAGGGGPR
jgi:RimJ/RimL family protein N-acetyltransferase